MLILGQKSCFLGPTIFEIPQPNWYYCRQNITCFNGVDDVRFTIHRHDRNTSRTQVLYKGDFGLVTDQITDEQGFRTQTFNERLFSSDSEVCRYTTSWKYSLAAVFRAGGKVLNLVGTKNTLLLKNVSPNVWFSNERGKHFLCSFSFSNQV